MRTLGLRHIEELVGVRTDRPEVTMQCGRLLYCGSVNNPCSGSAGRVHHDVRTLPVHAGRDLVGEVVAEEKPVAASSEVYSASNAMEGSISWTPAA